MPFCIRRYMNPVFSLAEKRVALKSELDRLKAEGPAVQKKSASKSQDDMGVSASKGSVSLQEIRLPLKADFVCSTANRPGMYTVVYIFF